MLSVFNTSYNEKTIVKVAVFERTSKPNATSGIQVGTTVTNAGFFDREMDWGEPDVPTLTIDWVLTPVPALTGHGDEPWPFFHS